MIYLIRRKIPSWRTNTNQKLIAKRQGLYSCARLLNAEVIPTLVALSFMNLSHYSFLSLEIRFFEKIA